MNQVVDRKRTAKFRPRLSFRAKIIVEKAEEMVEIHSELSKGRKDTQKLWLNVKHQGKEVECVRLTYQLMKKMFCD